MRVSQIDEDLLQYTWLVKHLKTGICYFTRDLSPKDLGINCLLCNLVMERKLGRPLASNEHVIYKDGDSTNNARENLELALIPPKKSYYKPRDRETGSLNPAIGVSWHEPRKKWQTRAHIKGVRYDFGLFDTPELAVERYNEGMKRLGGKPTKIKESWKKTNAR